MLTSIEIFEMKEFEKSQEKIWKKITLKAISYLPILCKFRRIIEKFEKNF